VSRRQQVDEGHLPTLEDVPRRAITVTIPRLLRAQHVVASVPGVGKRDAVRATLTAPVGPDHPGTALRTHPDVALFLDEESAPGDVLDLEVSEPQPFAQPRVAHASGQGLTDGRTVDVWSQELSPEQDSG